MIKWHARLYISTSLDKNLHRAPHIVGTEDIFVKRIHKTQTKDFRIYCVQPAPNRHHCIPTPTQLVSNLKSVDIGPATDALQLLAS